MNISKRFRTKWATTFYVAAELTKRGCAVSLTIGNTPEFDLLLVTPNDKQIMVDVKGLSGKNWWLVKKREPREGLFYVFVSLSETEQKYFTMSSKEVQELIVPDPKITGIRWEIPFDYENRWDKILNYTN